MAYSVRKIDRDTLPRDEDSEDDSEWLDDPVALGLQQIEIQDAGSSTLQNIERPSHISPETHDLVLKTSNNIDKTSKCIAFCYHFFFLFFFSISER